MSNLQWAILVLGILVVAGVYIYTRKTRPPDYMPPQEEDDPARPDAWNDEDEEDLDWLSRPEPEPDSDPFVRRPEQERVHDSESGPHPERLERNPAARADDERAVRMPEAPSDEQKLIVLHVAAPQGHRFGGEAVHDALRDCSLHFGPKLIYHRIKEVDGVPESVFSVANMVKPGYLDPAEREQLRIPGLSLFMVLPGPEEPVPAFRDLERTAHDLASALNGQVLDERRQPLTRQMAQFLHEEVAELERRLLASRGPLR